MNKRLIVVILSVIVVLGAVSAAWLYVSKTRQAVNSQSHASKSKGGKHDVSNIIHLAAMGDMLAHDTIIANAKVDNGYDFAKYFQNIKPAYANADMVFCNQEGPSAGEKYGISGYPTFNAPTEFSAGLKNGGCNVINLANNHMGDKGIAVTDATIDNWGSLKPLAISGANKSSYDQNNDIGYFTVKGIKVGFVAFADFNNNKSTPEYSVNIYHNEDLLRKLVTEARQKSDLVIVSMHWGTEDSASVNSDQIRQTNLLASLGTDIVLGTGPHVLQREETLTRPDGGKLVVWYSLGNMLSSQLNINELIGGIAGMDITKESGKISISNLTFTPTYMHYEWSAQQAAGGDLSARKNAMIYLLDNAETPLSKSLFNTSVAHEKQYVIDTLGANVAVK